MNLAPSQLATLATRYACPHPKRMRWATFSTSGAQCSGCAGSCGTSHIELAAGGTVEKEAVQLEMFKP